jgi:hypothetical protein
VCENDITTQRTIQDARLSDKLTRAEMAKIVSLYLISILDKKPDTTKDCSAFDTSIANYSTEMKAYMHTACQFNIMGIHPDYTALSDFRANDYVSRAEF